MKNTLGDALKELMKDIKQGSSANNVS